MFELVWTLFWILLGVIGIAASWPWLLIVIFFALAGIIWLDDLDFDW